MEIIPKSTPEKPLNIIKSEHLKKGEKPIMVSYGMPADDDILDEIKKLSRGVEVSGIDNADLYRSLIELKNKGFVSLGHGMYVIFPTNTKNKFLRNLVDCTALVVTGRDKVTGENISFITHQNPSKFLKSKRAEFKTDINNQLTTLRNQCEEGTVDVVIVGGKYIDSSLSDRDFKKDYLESIRLLTKEVKSVFDFEPVVVGGPKTVGGIDNIYYDTSNRRLYLLRPQSIKEAVYHPKFTESTMSDEKGKWDKDA